jgi:hypothetical protein
MDHTTIATFVDDTGLFATHSDPLVATHLDLLQEWFDTWRIVINQEKSSHMTFTTTRAVRPHMTMNNVQIPVRTNVKYLGLHLDQSLTWSTHIKSKHRHLDLKSRSMYWLLGRLSSLSPTSYSCISAYLNQHGHTAFNSGAAPSHPIPKSYNGCNPNSCGPRLGRRGMSPIPHSILIYASHL